MNINYDLVLPVLRIPDLLIAAPGFDTIINKLVDI
jgi:hypothetical protein